MLAGLVNQYRVLATIGAGGMGVVYKALDTRLNRPVAIKAIRESEDLTSDAVIRLRAEALAAASLDHPYICKIYELLDTESGTLIVMEYIEGETLAAVLSRGVPPLADALRYGSEIAEGLADAHDHGLIHRDVKPSNVMITLHGHVKLLDFGVVRVNAPGSGVTTTHSALTRPGGAPGTPLYMAPEQALGLAITPRADIFSLGIVLFECLTGQLPYDGGTRDAYVHAMLTGRKKRIEDLAPSVPEHVRGLVDACLKGEPSQRPESAAIVAGELRRSADAISSSGAYVSAPAIRRWTPLQIVVIVLATCALVGATLLWRAARSPIAGGVSIVPVVTAPSAELDGHLSPDGRWLSFLSDRDGAAGLYIQPFGVGQPRRIEVPPGTVSSHAWSPGSAEIACAVQQPGAWFLHVVPAFAGGLPRTTVPLVPAPQSVRVSRWIGESVYLDVDRGAAGEALWRVNLSSSRIEDLTAAWPADAVKRRSTADVNAAGTEVVFAASPEGQTDLWTARLDGSGLRRLTNDVHVERSPIWIGSTRTVAFQSNRSGQLDMWTIDVGTERTEQITSSETAESPADATADGSKMLYEQVAESATLWLLPAGSLEPQQLSADALTDLWPSVDARGTRVAFQRRRPALSEGLNFIDSSVLVASLSGAALSNPVAVADGFAARISPDGSWVAHMQRGADRVDVLQARNLQTGETRIVSRTVPLPIRSGRFPIDWAAQRVTWAPAGALLYFVEESSGQQAIARVDLAAPGSSASVLVRRPEIIEDVRLSPDGGRLAYLLWHSGRLEFHVRDLATAADAMVWQEAGSQVAAFLRGWTAGGALVFLRNRAPSRVARGANRVEVVAAANGNARIVSTIEDAFTATGRLNGDGSRLFITRIEGGVHNIAAVSMADGTVRNVTGNKQPGVSFTGIEPLADGALIFVRAELRQDIWLAERQAR